MTRILAYCGIVCSACPAYLATRSRDPAALARAAEVFRREYGIAGATAENVRCAGCPSDDGPRAGQMPGCPILACARGRSLPHCAACSEYVCGTLARFLRSHPDERATLDALRETGLATD